MHGMDYTDEEALEDEATMWRGVTDATSGKVYYYHIVTRESVWEKPLALCSKQERAEVAWREEQQRSFFADMEGNIRRKIQQGLFFADGAGGTPPQAQPTTPNRADGSDAGEKRSAGLLCRTISTMDDSVVAELTAAPASPFSSRGSSSDADMSMPLSPYRDLGGPTVMAPAPPPSSSTATCPPVLHALGRPNGSSGGGGRGGGRGEAGTMKRAPAHGGEVSKADVADTAKRRPHGSLCHRNALFAHGLCQSAAGELAGGEEVGSGGRGRGGRNRRAMGVSRGGTSGGGRGGEVGGAEEAVVLRGERIPPHLMRRNSTSTIYLAPHDTLSDPDLDAAIRCVCAVFRAHMIEAIMDRGRGGGGGVVSGARAKCGDGERRGERGGRGGTRRDSWQAADVSVFDDPPTVVEVEVEVEEMELPDIPSLEKLRRHGGDHAGGGGGGTCRVTAGGKAGQPRGSGANSEADAGAGTRVATVAQKDADTKAAAATVAADGGGAAATMSPGELGGQEGSRGGREGGQRVEEGKHEEVPLLRDITAYYRDLYHRTKLKFDCIVLSLIYVERLMKETKGALRPRPSNWRSLLMSVLVLSSKVWDDNSMWNRDFSELCPSFTLVRLNQLEVAVLEVLRYNVKVLSSEYAKYYFHLRAMCVRGGLSEDHAPIHPLDMEDVRVLEDLSSKLALRSVGHLNRSIKAHTLHNVTDAKLLQKVGKRGYAFTDRQAPQASLEQVVHNMRP